MSRKSEKFDHGVKTTTNKNRELKNNTPGKISQDYEKDNQAPNK